MEIADTIRDGRNAGLCRPATPWSLICKFPPGIAQENSADGRNQRNRKNRRALGFETGANPLLPGRPGGELVLTAHSLIGSTQGRLTPLDDP